ncbi:hypothetical protein [Candidatus Phyllobacterium onerii]|uniref:hypothetical protein n=1 Tax=Candidatus Phyllobacterium onerii TaxID=3020828 RepID=UPI00232FD195|nr:hypothetical protein [Phyllobacterium sp. IY22]
MKDIFGTGRNPARDTDQPSPMRRRILQACAYLPTAPLLAMLGGCDGDSSVPSSDTSTFTPPVAPPVKPPVTETVIYEKLDLKIPPFSDQDQGTNQTFKNLLLPIEEEPRQPVVQQVQQGNIIQVPGQALLPVQEEPRQPVVQQVQQDNIIQVPGQAPLPIEEEPRETAIQQVKQSDVIQVPAPAPSKPKKVGIYSLQYHSYKQVSARREVAAGTPGAVIVASEAKTYEGIESYLKRSLDNRFALLYRAMITAFEKRSPTEFDVSFVTAPEFYWNVPFGDFWTKEELEFGADLCLNTVTKHVQTLIKKFPAWKYGHIVMLPGTIAMLKPMADPRKPNDTKIDGTIYEAFNHVVCTHNLPLNDGAKRPAYMIWPKRTVSHIDFYDELAGSSCGDPMAGTLKPNPLGPDLVHPMMAHVKNPIYECIISVKHNLKVKIGYVTSSVGRSYDSDDKLISGKFQNNIIDGLPFGIDICMDYYEASVQKNQHRISQIDERNFKLDFVLSAGIDLLVSTYDNTPYIQYAIHNDGIGREKAGLVEVWKLTWTPGKPSVTQKRLIFGKWMDWIDRFPSKATKEDSQPLESQIAINQREIFDAPAGSDTKDIPNILDKMNAALVSIWQLDVVQPVETVVASNPVPITVADKTIQFIK